MSILAINGGAAAQIESLQAPRYRHYFDRLVRPEDLENTNIDAFDAVLVPCRTPAHRMTPHAKQLLSYLDQGGTVVAMGECHSHLWLPNIKFTPVETNFWWWLESGSDLGVTITADDHPLFKKVGPRDVAWHLHGYFEAPQDAEVLLANKEGRPILYFDEATTRGRMIINSLDPFFHHGHHFMPATTRFLDGFLQWLVEDIAGRTGPA
jgi:hypothetical protein